jgi:hypothetical protein
LRTTREFILERNPMNVKSVVRPLTSVQTSDNIREFIPERSLTSVKNVARPLPSVQPLDNII